MGASMPESLFQRASRAIVSRLGADGFRALTTRQRAIVLYTEIRRLAGLEAKPPAEPMAQVAPTFGGVWQSAMKRVGKETFDAMTDRSRAALIYEEMRQLDAEASRPAAVPTTVAGSSAASVRPGRRK